MKFYEVQQRTQTRWTPVGYFILKQNAEDHVSEFNTKTEVSPLRIREREFLDFGDFDDIRDFLFKK
jgi:hypothetical protein